jgi:Xaa-Pro aminopeptidase
VYTQPIALHSINSIEPGYYCPGWGGIRLENLSEVCLAEALKRAAGTPQGDWYRYQTITWVPFEPSLIDEPLLTEVERAWLDAYHRECAQQLAETPLSERAKQWLQAHVQLDDSTVLASNGCYV